MDSGALLWLLALVEYSKEALARGFWSSSIALGLSDGFSPLRECFRAESLALGFWSHVCLHGQRCGCKIRRYDRVGRTCHSHFQLNNTVDSADGNPFSTALLLSDKKESGTI